MKSLRLTLTLSDSGDLFPQGSETQWKTHDHSSCLPLLALTEIIYTPAYWNFGDRDREREWGGGGSGLLLQIWVNVVLTADEVDLDADWFI